MASRKPVNSSSVPVAKNVYPGEELVTIKLPLTKSEQDDVHVKVNDRDWIIKRGFAVQVPKCVAEVIEHAEEAMLAGIEYQEAHQRSE